LKPEKIKITKPGYTVKSDIWSLGVSMVYFILLSKMLKD